MHYYRLTFKATEETLKRNKASRYNENLIDMEFFIKHPDKITSNEQMIKVLLDEWYPTWEYNKDLYNCVYKETAFALHRFNELSQDEFFDEVECSDELEYTFVTATRVESGWKCSECNRITTAKRKVSTRCRWCRRYFDGYVFKEGDKI